MFACAQLQMIYAYCMPHITFQMSILYLRHIYFVNNSEGTDSIFVMNTRYGHPMFTGTVFYQCFVGSKQTLFKASVYSILRCIACSFEVLSLIKYISADLMNWISINEKCSNWNLWDWIFSLNFVHVKFIFIEFILTQLFRWQYEYFMIWWYDTCIWITMTAFMRTYHIKCVLIVIKTAQKELLLYSRSIYMNIRIILPLRYI